MATPRNDMGALGLPAKDRFNHPSGVLFTPGVPISM
jgi:hypothetical protein